MHTNPNTPTNGCTIDIGSQSTGEDTPSIRLQYRTCSTHCRSYKTRGLLCGVTSRREGSGCGSRTGRGPSPDRARDPRQLRIWQGQTQRVHVPLAEETILDSDDFHGPGTFFVIIRHVVDTSAYGITPHQLSIVRLQQFGRRPWGPLIAAGRTVLQFCPYRRGPGTAARQTWGALRVWILRGV